MNPYSKINVIPKNKSRSSDFSDLVTSPEPTKTNLHNLDGNTITNQELSSVPEDRLDHESTVEHVQGFGTTTVALKRNSSVSAASASALESAVKRAFSMRGSSSVSERYCRIHDQFTTSPSHDEDGFVERTRSVKKKSSRCRIFRACKRLFGL